MKIGIITDTHFGIKADASFMLAHQEKFFNECFFPYLEKHGITTVFHLGDLFDRRKYINFQTLDRTKKIFLDVLRDRNIQMYIIPGNHDCALKSSNKINSLAILLGEYDNICVFEEPYVYHDKFNPDMHGCKFLFIPWINQENYEDIIKFTKENPAQYLLGHLELAGFDMYPGIRNEHGMDASIFSHFEEVWTGHYHTRSSKGNVKYLGAPFEYNLGDAGDPKGFHIFDTATKELTFEKNPFILYEKVYWDDSCGDEYEDQVDNIKKTDFSKFENKIVRVYVIKKTKPALYDWFVENLYKSNPIDMVIHEDYSEFHQDNVDIEMVKDMSTTDLIKGYIDTVETDMDKTKLKNIMDQLYIEALHSEAVTE